MPQWYRHRGDDYDESGAHFEEYTDSEEVADGLLDVFGGYTEEVAGPASDPDLNQPQTYAGRMQCRAAEYGMLAGHDARD